MSEQTVAVRVLAHIQGYIDPIRRATQYTRDFTAEMDRAAKGRKLDEVAAAGTRLGLALVAMSGVAVAASARFEAAMSEVGAATGATGAELGRLSDAALQAGADTSFSASEAAGAITELGKAGLSTADIMGGGLSGALNLAAAGQVSVAEAAETASAAMVQFKLTGRDVGHIADLLAAGAGKALGSVGDMSQALKQAGLVASQTGLSIEETTATLAAFASAGMLGSDAGTSLRTMLLRLSAPSGEAARLMDELGIAAYDTTGRFVGMERFAGNLRDALGGMTDAQRNATLATVFGQDAIRAATVLYDEGAAGIREWTSEVDDAGYAARQAQALTDNLKGDIERLTGSLETLFITSGEGANGALRFMTQRFEQLVDTVSDLPGWVQQAGVAVVGVIGVLALGTAGMIKFRGATAAAALQLAAMGPAGLKAAAGMTAIGRAAGPVGLALTAIGAAFAFIPAEASVAQRLLRGPIDDIGRRLGVMGATFEETIGNVDRALSGMDSAEAMRMLGDAAARTGVPVQLLADQFENYRAAQAQADAKTRELAGSTEHLARAQLAAVAAGQSLIDIWNELHGAAKTADEEMLDAKEAIDAVGESFTENGNRIDGNSEAALRNRLALAEAAQQAVEAADAFIDNGGSAADAAAMLDAFKRAAVDAAVAAGADRDAVRELAAALFKLPTARTIDVRIRYSANLGPSGQAGPHMLGLPIFQAQGGITRAADGLIRQGRAGISSRPVLWAEAGTEAYIPQGGGHSRALAIGAQAMDWHGADVVPRGGGGFGAGMGGGAGRVAVDVTVRPAPGAGDAIYGAMLDRTRFDVTQSGGGDVQRHMGRRGRV